MRLCLIVPAKLVTAMLRRRIWGALSGLVLAATAIGAEQPLLSPRLSEAPYAYRHNGARAWPFLTRAPARDETIRLVAKLEDGRQVESSDGLLEAEGLTIAVTRAGKLEITAGASATRPSVALDVEVRRNNQVAEKQPLMVRPAPPDSPVTYYADFGDDLINIFGAGVSGSAQTMLHHNLREGGGAERRPRTRTANGLPHFDKAGFDQYFRRLQNQGVSRLILWMFPFPFITDASAYGQEAWDLYQRNAQALLGDDRLQAQMLADPSVLVRWGWLRDLMAFRFDPAIHRALSDSAIEHGITLAVSYRPFEQAGSKYYELPVFDADGSFLWNFQPLSSPAVNLRAERIGFAHYREILARMGRPSLGQISRIELAGVRDAEAFVERYRKSRDNLRIVAANFPPVQMDTRVLVRQRNGEFRLTPFRDIAAQAHQARREIKGFEVSVDPVKGLVITKLDIPAEYAFVMIENPSHEIALPFKSEDPIRLFSAEGSVLGRNATYVVFSGESREEQNTRIAGVTNTSDIHAVFFAADASRELLLKNGLEAKLGPCSLVIDRGPIVSREMVDFERSEARANVVAEMRSVLKYPAFREIYVNTRSHTSLIGAYGAGAGAVKPIVHFLATKQPYAHLGLDLAYAPVSAVENAALRARATADQVAAITDFHAGEWDGRCEPQDSTKAWRSARNQGVAAGVRLLLKDLSAAFPNTRLRVVAPESPAVDRAVKALLPALPASAPTYTRSRNNYIQNIGEGVAMVDLSGLTVEPVLLGTGPSVDPQILKIYLDTALQDLATNRGSRYRGPRGVMYEGQSTLKDAAGKQAREAVMRSFLSRQGEIDEVIVYEAADWAYRLPWDGFDFLGKRTRE